MAGHYPPICPQYAMILVEPFSQKYLRYNVNGDEEGTSQIFGLSIFFLLSEKGVLKRTLIVIWALALLGLIRHFDPIKKGI